jgi:hypothetical protein
MSCMFGDPFGGETLHLRDGLSSQTVSDGLLQSAAQQGDFDLHFHGAAQLRAWCAIAHGRQPRFGVA